MVITTQSTKIKPEYKQTEVGVIPKDWEVHTLGDEIDQLEAGISVNSVDEKFHIYAHEQAILKTSAVLNGYFFPHESKRIAPRDIKRAKLNPRVNSIIISRMNTPDLVGECGYVDRNYDNLFLPDRLWMTRFKRGSRINVKWLSYLLNLKEYKAKIKEAATGTSNSMKNISKDSLLSICIPFPTPEEQQAIATALSDVDALITSLDKLIAKKRDIKQATMQQLLTGKTRLPGFSGEWEVKRLGTLLTFQVGFPFSSVFFNQRDNGIRLIKNRDLKSNDQIYHYSREYSPAYLVTDGDLLVGMDGDFMPCLWRKGPALLNQRVGRIITSLEMDRMFTYYSLIKPLKMIEIRTSSTTVKHLSHGDIEDIEIPIPDINEQIAISTILSDMDAEIAALEQKRDKTRALKQGMMQELLTGKTRLVTP
jgi:type I restriction enzyme S subunit